MLSIRLKHLFESTFVLATLCMPATAYADVKDLTVWWPDRRSPVKYIIPELDNGSPELFAELYLAAMKASEFGKLEDAQRVKLSTSTKKFEKLPSSTKEHPLVAVILDRPNQMGTQSKYVKTVTTSFQLEGPRLYSVPSGLSAILTDREMDQFREQLRSFDGMLGIGGDDPHPATYGKRDTSKVQGDISLLRDREVSGYLMDYLEHGRGRMYVICGAHQKLGILDGQGFHTDVSDLTLQPHLVPDKMVLREVRAAADSEIALAAGSTQFMTSNSHHAAIDPANPQGLDLPTRTRVVAYNINKDGSRGEVAMGMDLKDNAGFGTQFHFELRGSREEERMVKYVTTSWKIGGRVAPAEILDCMTGQIESGLKRLPATAP